MIEIAYLADEPQHLETVARWQHQSWAHVTPEKSLKDRIEEARRTMNKGEAPTTFIAVEGEEVLGSASLTLDEMDSHTEINPWIASVYVAEGHRRRGIATALLGRIIDEAKALGFKEIYLFTYDHQSLYERLGWQKVSVEKYRDRTTTIMRRPFSDI